jgi:dTDP-4-amino-4,6-dideoxygalactose transaminase
LYIIQSPQRDALAAYLKACGIGTAIHYPVPIHRQTAYRDLGTDKQFPIAERLAQEILSLPMYPELPLDDIRVVAQAVVDFSSGKGRR